MTCWVLALTVGTFWLVKQFPSTCGPVQIGLTSTQLEKIMFVDSRDATQYRSKCGKNWQQMFVAWEQRQRAAINGDTAVKAIVWRCRRFCGGFGDRQRGILTSFLLALVTDRAFFIDSEIPVPLQHYFHVATPDLHWTFDDSLLNGRQHIEEDFRNAFPAVGDFASANLSYYDPYDVVIQLNNFWQPLGILRNPSLKSAQLLRSYEDHVLAGCILNYLLVPSRDLQTLVSNSKKEAEKSDRHMMALQIRTGDSQFKNDTVMDTVTRYFSDCITSIQRISRSKYTIFLTTDSDAIQKRFRAAHADLKVFDGEIVHVDGAFGSADSSASAFRKIVLDHMMISQAKTLILSRSGFGEMAALRGFKPYHTPLKCDLMPHYNFPSQEPQGVPATNISSLEELFSGFQAAVH